MIVTVNIENKDGNTTEQAIASFDDGMPGPEVVTVDVTFDHTRKVVHVQVKYKEVIGWETNMVVED